VHEVKLRTFWHPAHQGMFRRFRDFIPADLRDFVVASGKLKPLALTWDNPKTIAPAFFGVFQQNL
jgi:hypothetical protein